MMPTGTESSGPIDNEVKEEKPHLESAKDDADFCDAARHAVPLPEAWWRRWPAVAVVVTMLAALAGIGHIMGGLADIARFLDPLSVEKHSQKDTAPRPEIRPLAITLSESETRSLDGYIINEAFRVPQPQICSTLLAGGAQTRIIFQANPSVVVEISRLSLEAKRLGKEIEIASLYQVDPTLQSGFGAARPRTFKITFDGTGQGSAFYINERSESQETSLSNLLATREFSLLRLDGSGWAPGNPRLHSRPHNHRSLRSKISDFLRKRGEEL